ncbi:Eco57I restriction-modification methylase domain-containing protein, partial [Psychrobacter sp. 16-Bac2893]
YQEAVINKDGTKRKKTDKQIATEKVAFDSLNAYRDWLLQITICDPAVGSGAFLNEALNFLITEHEYIVELETKLFGSGLAYPDIENSILENNLFGVDINEESVEIAKLSLWLRTAQPRRKLNNLNDNIQCGNSLIDDPAVAGDKAFNWQTAFPQVFAKGGFDVVIGNPPYLRVQGLRGNFEEESKFYDANFKSATGRFDIYVLFMEKSFDLIKTNSGVISYILPHKFLISGFGEGIRSYLLNKKGLESLIHFGSEMVFADASTYTCIIKLSYNNRGIKFVGISPQEISAPFTFDSTSYKYLSSDMWNLKSDKVESVFNKLSRQLLRAENVFSSISAGVDTGSDDIFIMKGTILGDKFHGYSDRLEKPVTLEASIVKPMLKGGDVKKYAPISNEYFVIYPFKIVNSKTTPIAENIFKEIYPTCFEYLFQFKEELIKKKIHKKTNPEYWYSLHRSRHQALFEQTKIITPETSLGGNLTIDRDYHFHNTQVYSLIKNDNIQEDYRFWLSILNSSIFWFYLKETGAVLRGGYFRFKTKHLEPFPFPKLKNLSDETPYVKQVDFLLSSNKEFYNINIKFIKYFISSYNFENISRKLENWYELSFADFIKELNKAIKAKNKTRCKEGRMPIAELTKKDEFEWMELFEAKKKEVLELQQQIQQTEKEIDQMVYKLYDLTADEIAIIEAS